MNKAKSLQEQSEGPQQGYGDLGSNQTNTCKLGAALSFVCPKLGNENAEMMGRFLM